MMFVMWVVMMIAMMTPTATPMILLFAAINRKRRERDAPYIPTAFFLGGYLAAWVGFSAAATLRFTVNFSEKAESRNGIAIADTTGSGFTCSLEYRDSQAR